MSKPQTRTDALQRHLRRPLPPIQQKNRPTRLRLAAGKPFSLINGPKFVEAAPLSPPPAGSARGTAASTAPPLPESTLASLTQKTDGTDILVSATYTGNMQSITYRIRPNGWLTIDYAYNLSGTHELFGVGFDYPESKVQGIRYLGNGPAPVFQNRLAGGTLDVWEKKYNNTMVGNPDDLKPGEHFDYPEFKGYYAGVRWIQLQTTEGPITALVPGGQYVQIFAPKTAGDIGQTGVPYPSGGISFLDAIPAIGSKFNRATTSGPMLASPPWPRATIKARSASILAICTEAKRHEKSLPQLCVSLHF